MKTETLKQLITAEFNRNSAPHEFYTRVLELIDLYEQDKENTGLTVYPSTGNWPWGTQGGEKVPYHVTCSCNPINGGSGVCNCIMGQRIGS